jgi:hypothetical protein
MNSQDLNSATKLYTILGEYVPEVPNEDYLDYINAIFENIKNSGNYNAYFDAVQLMTGATYNTLTQQEPQDVLELFINSLMEWHIVELVAFFRNIGYSDDRSS